VNAGTIVEDRRVAEDRPVDGRPGIRLEKLRVLWVHTGTACNLSCPFCHEGSKPGDDRLQAPSLDEIVPLLEQAAARGVEQFAFTGGEPLILKGIGEILLRALELAPVRVLTNGTAPFIRRSHQLAQLRNARHALSFLVSIDSPEESVHDAGRGLKNFRKALEGLRLLHEAGFATGILSQPHAPSTRAALETRFRSLLRKHLLPQDLPIEWLPELGALHAAPTTPSLQMPVARHSPPCATGRMLLRRGGALALTACPMVDDDPGFDMPPELPGTIAAPVEPRHRRCAACLAGEVRYGGL